MENFSVSTVLTLGDWHAVNRAARLRVYSSPNILKRLLIRVPMLLLAVMLVAGLFWLRSDREIGVFTAGILGTILLVAAQSVIALRLQRAATGGRFLGPTRYEFTPDGVQVARTGSEGRTSWTAIHSVDNTPSHVFVWIDRFTGYVIPARDLSAGLDAGIVTTRLRTFIAQAKAAPGGAVAPTEYAAPPPTPAVFPPAPRVTLLQELGALGKQLLLMRADAARLVGSDGAIALLGMVALIVWLPLDWFIYDGPLEFMPEQAGGLACVIAGALALAWILSRLSLPRIEYRRVLLLVTAAMFIAIAGSVSFTVFADGWFSGLLVVLPVTAYATYYFKRGLQTLSGIAQARAVLVGAIATLLFVSALDGAYINPSLWVYTGDDDAELAGGANYQDAWRRIQDLQFDQQALIDAQIAQIATHSAPGGQVYFVGFAGYGEQRVFAQEIDLAAKRVAERYGAAERELRLVNDRRDLEKYPLATARALRHSLLSLGKVMDADDVLFLALSSHGAGDATLSVSNSGMMPADLDVDELSGALRDSGIRWKVIVISACHAGSFIDKLADDHTIVLTAAAPDRTSFGCSDDRDLTYFGEAFYRDALPKAATLRSAFEAAKASIALREKAEKVEASDPQAAFGTALEAKLEPLERK